MENSKENMLFHIMALRVNRECEDGYHVSAALSSFKVTLDLCGCPQEKNLYARILKENTANFMSLESLINVDFGKNVNRRFLQFPKRKSQSTTKMTMCHSIELIAYQIQAHWQNNYTVLIPKDQSSKVCQYFSIF